MKELLLVKVLAGLAGRWPEGVVGPGCTCRPCLPIVAHLIQDGLRPASASLMAERFFVQPYYSEEG